MKHKVVSVLFGVLCMTMAAGCQKNEAETRAEIVLSVTKPEPEQTESSSGDEKIMTEEQYMEEAERSRAWGEHLKLPPNLGVYGEEFRMHYASACAWSSMQFCNDRKMLEGSGKMYGNSRTFDEAGNDVTLLFHAEAGMNVRVHVIHLWYGSDGESQIRLLKDGEPIWSSEWLSDSRDFYLNIDEADAGCYQFDWVWNGTTAIPDGTEQTESIEAPPFLSFQAFTVDSKEEFTGGEIIH